MSMNETRYFSAPDLQLRNKAGVGKQASGYPIRRLQHDNDTDPLQSTPGRIY